MSSDRGHTASGPTSLSRVPVVARHATPSLRGVTVGRWLVPLAVSCVLSLALTGCQTVQHIVAFSEARRDPQLARIFGARAKLEEQYRECRVEHPTNHAQACAAARAKLDTPPELTTAADKVHRRWPWARRASRHDG